MHRKSQLRCSCIEKAKSGVRIDHPYQWQTLIQAAWRKNPFDVAWMYQTDFYDFSTTLGGIYIMLCSNVNKQVKDVHGNPSRIRWFDLRHVMFEKPKHQKIIMHYKYCLNVPFQVVEVGILPRKTRADHSLI